MRENRDVGAGACSSQPRGLRRACTHAPPGRRAAGQGQDERVHAAPPPRIGTVLACPGCDVGVPWCTSLSVVAGL